MGARHPSSAPDVPAGRRFARCEVPPGFLVDWLRQDLGATVYVAHTPEEIPLLMRGNACTERVAILHSASTLRRPHLRAGSWSAEVVPSHAIDLSGAFLPGIGVPMALLLGDPQHQIPLHDAEDAAPRPATTRILRMRRGEPRTPATPEQGILWRAVRRWWDTPGDHGDVLVEDVPIAEWLSVAAVWSLP